VCVCVCVLIHCFW